MSQDTQYTFGVAYALQRYMVFALWRYCVLVHVCVCVLVCVYCVLFIGGY